MYFSTIFCSEDIRSHLEEFGWVVVPGVVSAQECDQHIADINTWLKKFENDFPNNKRSLIQDYNVGHLESVWKARLKTKPLFEAIWGTSKLHSSTDGIAVGRPPEDGITTFDDVTPGTTRLHLDQGPPKRGLHAYQGALYLEEALEDDWTFMIIENSHKNHKDFFKRHKSSRNEFRLLTKNEVEWYEDRGCQVKRLTIPKGGMVLWDSRTAHAGAPPKMGRRNPGRWRYIVFASMTPAIWAGLQDLEEKRKGYKTLGLSRHWSSSGFTLFKPSCKHKGTITQLPEIAKSQEVKLLCGMMEYDFSDGMSNGPRWKPAS